jgi:chromosome segregation ATPase
MPYFPSIEAIRNALAPMEELRGEHSAFEAWILESFAALENLHGELADWQRDMTRQQAMLDQVEAALAEATGHSDAEATARFERQLAEAREQIRQLKEDNADLRRSGELAERQLAIAQTELRITRKHSDELAASLEAERVRAADDRSHWTSEVRELRRLLERQTRVAGGAEADAADSDSAPPPSP